MKKYILIIFISVLSLTIFLSNKRNHIENYVLKTLKKSSIVFAESTTCNTGPRTETTCAGLQNKHRMVCKCENPYPCSDSGCY